MPACQILRHAPEGSHSRSHLRPRIQWCPSVMPQNRLPCHGLTPQNAESNRWSSDARRCKTLGIGHGRAPKHLKTVDEWLRCCCSGCRGWPPSHQCRFVAVADRSLSRNSVAVAGLPSVRPSASPLNSCHCLRERSIMGCSKNNLDIIWSVTTPFYR